MDEDSQSKRFFTTFKKISRCGVFNSSQQCIRGTGVLSRFLTISKERNRICEKTVKSLLQVRVNLDYSCSELHKLILKDQKLQSQIIGSEKYQ